MNPQCPDPNCNNGWIRSEFALYTCPNAVHATPAAEVIYCTCPDGFKNPAKHIGNCPANVLPEPTAESADKQEIYDILNHHDPKHCVGTRKNPCPEVAAIQALLATAKAESYKQGVAYGREHPND